MASSTHTVEDPTPRSRNKASTGTKTNNNPYSTVGLDKFSSVVADLEARKEMVLAKRGAQGVSAVKFTYNDSKDWMPIVVKLRDHRNQQQEEEAKPKQNTNNTHGENPYSTRGLDKFSSVLADLEAKKEMILAKAGGRGISSVKFTYKDPDSQDWIPILVRLQDRHRQEEEKSKSTAIAKGENPYSARGLDKFSGVVADLEAKKEKILAKAGGQEVSSVKFTYNDSTDWVPIVARPRGARRHQHQHHQQEDEKSKQKTDTDGENLGSARRVSLEQLIHNDILSESQSSKASTSTSTETEEEQHLYIQDSNMMDKLAQILAQQAMIMQDVAEIRAWVRTQQQSQEPSSD